MHQKVYACVFRPVKARCQCFSSRIYFSANERKRSSRRFAL